MIGADCVCDGHSNEDDDHVKILPKGSDLQEKKEGLPTLCKRLVTEGAEVNRHWRRRTVRGVVRRTGRGRVTLHGLVYIGK